jgi:hypothetical protein
MKNKILTILCTVLLLFMSGCPTEPDPDKSNTPDENSPPKYGKEFLGEWIRMDTGERWYFSGNTIRVNGAVLNKTATLTKTAEEVITVKEAGLSDYFLFASRVTDASFSAHVVFIDGNGNNASRSLIGNDGQRPPIKVTNPQQPEQPPVIVQPDPDTGEITVPGQIPGDPVTIVPDDPEWGHVKVEVTPWDDQDMGIIPLAHGVNLKALIRMADTGVDITELYANGSPHNYVIEIENIGTANCVGASYELSWEEDDFSHSSGSNSIRATLDTIVPGGKKQINLTIGSKPIANEHKNKKINVTIVNFNVTTGNTERWEDTVSVNYYKVAVPFRFRSQKPVQGVIRTPRNKTYYFKTSGAEGNCTYSVNLPWSSKNYVITFLGASVETQSETKYSLAIDGIPPFDWDSLWGEDMFRYEAVNKSVNIAPVLDLTDNNSFMYYLYTGAVQYYRINLGTVPPEPNGNDLTIPGTGLADQLAWLGENAQSGVNYTVIVNANESLNSTVLSYSGKDYINITIISTGSGRTVTSSFTVGDGVTLTLGNNITLRGTASVRNGGALVMNTGSRIIGTAPSSGVVNTGTFTMYGGEIFGVTNSGTFTMYGGKISGDRVGMFSTGRSSIFTMYEGEISGCSSNGVSFNGTFIMNGGKITGNSGGVYVNSNQVGPANFIMNGGEISSNTASVNGGGGGVTVSEGTFTMNSGTISNNTAHHNGGGVSIYNGNFTMNGGVVSGNTVVQGQGGGVYMDNGTFRIVTGTIYGSNENNTSLKNTAASSAALEITINTIPEYGIFSNGVWNSRGRLSRTNNTIRVVNGVLQ